MSENSSSNNSYNIIINKYDEKFRYPKSSGDVLKTLNYECKKCRDPIKITKFIRTKKKQLFI